MSARDHALLELDRRRLPGWPADLLRHGRRIAAPDDARDHALAERILLGAIKNQLHLRWLIAHYAGRSLKSIDPLVQKILAIALYQLRFMQRIPASAAVNEAVEQARRFGLGRASGFVNAVLRKATREPPPPLPDPETDPAMYAEIALSHPGALYERLAKMLGPHKALRFCEHNNAEPPTLVRLFRGASVGDLKAEGVSVTAHDQPGMFIVEGARPAILAEWAERGLAQVQDTTAAAVVPELQIQPGQSVLDRCAGLGTKTLQMHEAAGTEGMVVAVDPSEARCAILRGLVDRRQLANIAVHQVGMLAQLPPEQLRPFDRILIDVPCSNSGVLARRPEARYTQDKRTLASLARLQDRILDDTAGWLKPGGRLVYSTCSIWDEENQQRVAEFVARHPEYRVLEVRTTLPSFEDNPARYRDGGYFAVLSRD